MLATRARMAAGGGGGGPTLPTPVFVSSNTGQIDGTNLTINKPSGTASGHVLLAIISNPTSKVITPPSGWATHQTGSVCVYTKAAGGSEPATYSWTWAGAQGANGVIVVYSGVDTTTPVEVLGQQGGSSTTATAPSVTTTGVNRMIVSGFYANAFTTISTPTGTTSRAFVQGDGRGSSPPTTRAVEHEAASAGATSSKSATLGTSTSHVGVTIALKPGS